MAASGTEHADLKEHPQMDPEVKPIYGNLVGIRDRLAAMKKHSEPHSFDEVRKYQQMLDAIDSKREDGIFGGSLKSGHIPSGQAACREVLDQAYDLISSLQASATDMDVQIRWIYGTLRGIRRKLEAMVKDKNHTFEDVQHYQQMVDSIDRKRVDGIFAGSPQTSIPAGQAECAEELARCYELLDKARATAQEMSMPIRALHGTLIGIRKQLLRLKEQRPQHTLNELRMFQYQLDGIDSNRHDGIFGGSPNSRIPAGQAVLADVLAECYELLKELQDTAVDVEESPSQPSPGAAHGAAQATGA